MTRSISRFGVSAILAGLSATVVGIAPARADDADKPVRALLVLGGCCHDYEKQKDILTKGVSARANVSWAVSYDPDKGTKHLNPVYGSDEWFKGYDVIVHDECTADVKDKDTIDRVLKPHKDGLPAVVLHCGMHSFRGEGFPKDTDWFKFTGLATTGHGPQLPVAVNYVEKDHPITKGLEDWRTANEELYNNVSGKLYPTATAIARGQQTVKGKDGKERTDDNVLAWTNTYNGKARVFGTTLGHNNGTVADDRYLDLVARGLLWSVDKLDAAHLKPAKKVMLDDPAK
jgi:type 1 glutamine amidotransferase